MAARFLLTIDTRTHVRPWCSPYGRVMLARGGIVLLDTFLGHGL